METYIGEEPDTQEILDFFIFSRRRSYTLVVGGIGCNI